jgi:hypothetical protein
LPITITGFFAPCVVINAFRGITVRSLLSLRNLYCMKHLFTASLIFFCSIVLAQDFAITTKGDTLKGKIKIINTDFSKSIQITTADKKKTTLNILQVKSFVHEGERFETVRKTNMYFFMKPIKKGYLSLYAFQYEKQFTYDGRFMVKLDGTSLEVPNLLFKKTVSAYLPECTEVAIAVEGGTWGRNDLEAIVSHFNECIEKKSAQTFAQPAVVNVNTDTWNQLLQKIESSQLENKEDAIDMAMDVKVKVSRGERIPKFLVNVLTEALAADLPLSAALSEALKTIKQ